MSVILVRILEKTVAPRAPEFALRDSGITEGRRCKPKMAARTAFIHVLAEQQVF
jgi:hypothetical protein